MTAGLERTELYLTNAVKHFKWTPRGKRRIHQTPNRGELVACRPWLEAEIAAVQPELIVALGATAAKALIGPDVRVTRDRGLFVDQDGVGLVMPTVIRPRAAGRRLVSGRGVRRLRRRPQIGRPCPERCLWRGQLGKELPADQRRLTGGATPCRPSPLT